MKSNILSFATILFCLFVFSSNAQQAQKQYTIDNHPIVKSLADDMDLTEDQKSKIVEIFEQHRAERKANRENGVSPAQGSKGDVLLQLKDILTDEQIAQVKEKMVPKRPRRDSQGGNKAEWMRKNGGDWQATKKGSVSGEAKRKYHEKSSKRHALLLEMRKQFDSELKRKDRKTIVELRAAHDQKIKSYKAIKEEYKNAEDKKAVWGKLEALMNSEKVENKEKLIKLLEKYDEELLEIFAANEDQLKALKGEKSYKNPHAPGFKGKYMGCAGQQGVRSPEGSMGKKNCPENSAKSCSPADCAKKGITCSPADCAKTGKTCSPKDCAKMGKTCSPADCAKKGKTCSPAECAKMGITPKECAKMTPADCAKMGMTPADCAKKKSCDPADCKDKSMSRFSEEQKAEWKAKKQKMRNIKFLLMDPNTEIETQTRTRSIEPVVADVSTIKCFPNPAVNQTTVKYDVTNAGNIIIEVRDETGKLVNTLVKEFKEEGTYTVELSTLDLKSSIYFITIIDEVGINTDKLIISKR